MLPRVSASKLKLWQECPKMYEMRYVRGEEQKPNVWALVGSGAHKAIETYYKTGRPILATYAEWIAEHVTSAAVEGIEYAPNLIAGIQNGLKNFDTTLYDPLEVDGVPQLEKRFRLPYPDAENPICTIEGFIDCVTATQVVDYKTGKDTPSIKAVERDLQFIIYHWAYERLYGVPPKEIVYHRLRDNKRIIGKKFDITILDSVLREFLTLQTVYNLDLCDDCPSYCGMRKYVIRQAAPREL